MLKRVLGALLCVVGLVVAGLAVASATVWRAPDTLTASATAASGSTLVLTDPGVLDLAADEVTVRAEADGAAVVVALGRTVDVQGWVGDSPATTVTGLADRTTLATTPDPGGSGAAESAPSPTAPDEGAPEDAAPEDAAPEEGGGEETAAEQTPPDPRGSDLWVEEASGEGAAELRWEAEEGRWSVLVAAVGPDVRPTVTLSWPQTVTTPWLAPGLVVGGLLLLAGATLLVLALRRPRERSATPAGSAVPSGAPGRGTPSAAAPDPTAGAAAPADRPLTRRELRQLQARGAAPTPPTAPATPPTGPATPPTGPATPPRIGGARPPVGPPARGQDAGEASGGTTRAAGPGAGRGSAVPESSAPERTSPDATSRPDGRDGRGLPPAAGRLGPRRTGAGAPQPDGPRAGASPEPPSAPSGPGDGPTADAPRPGATGDAEGTPVPGPAGRPSPGASAWRQTWGLPAGETTTGGAGPRPAPTTSDAEETPPAPVAEPDVPTSDDGGDR